MKILVSITLLFFCFTVSAQEKCDWCTNGKVETLTSINSLLELSPKEQLGFIESQGVKVYILDSKRKSSSQFFQWSTIRLDKGLLTDISKIEGSLGKTLCKNERLIAVTSYTIILSSDAPLSTLIHEYLHVLQIKKSPSWCKLSLSLWSDPNPSLEKIKVIRNHEWDVRQTLWKLISNKAFNIEDRIVIAEGYINEAKLRESFDPSAIKKIEIDKVNEYLNSLIKKYSENSKN